MNRVPLLPWLHRVGRVAIESATIDEADPIDVPGLIVNLMESGRYASVLNRVFWCCRMLLSRTNIDEMEQVHASVTRSQIQSNRMFAHDIQRSRNLTGHEIRR